jgi:DNA-binding MarR family transcriptional regulator
MSFFDNLSPSARELLRAVHRLKHLDWAGSMTQQGLCAERAITKSELLLLFFLKKPRAIGSTGFKVSEISQEFKVSPANITQLVTGLEARGLVIRTMDPNDRRVVRVTLSPDGESAVSVMGKKFTAVFTGLSERLGPDGCDQLVSLINKTADYLSELSATERRTGDNAADADRP